MRKAALLLFVVVAAACGAQHRSAPSGSTPSAELANAHPVAGNFRPDGTKLSTCHDQRCYEQAFGNVAYLEGPKAALALFDEKMRTDTAINSGCHRIAHAIGAASLAHFHDNVPRAFTAGSASCWSGYYHGILERAFMRAQTDSQFVRIAQHVCTGSFLRRSLWLRYQCVHGLGHGLMLQTGYNLPFSLKVCDKLADAWSATSCTGGVFMENINGAVKSGYGTRTPWVKESDLVFPCDWVKEHYKLYCYLMVTSRILQANGYNWRGAAKICARVERGWVDTCFQSYGRDASGYSRQDPRQILTLCRVAGTGFDQCVYGAVRDVTSNDSGPRRALKLCARAGAAQKKLCYYGIGTILGTINSTTLARRQACTGAPRRYQRECFRGADGRPI